MTRLVLFDIDGTLLSCGRVPAEAVREAVAEALGRAVDVSGYEFSGKTDPQIVRELLAGHGATLEQQEALLPAARDGYQRRLAGRLRPEHVRAKPGVGPLVEALAARPDVALGLLTGNLEPCARLKLDPLGLNPRFPFGAFGSDDADRYRLVPVALTRAQAHHGVPFRGEDTVVIGDSVHDVLCGRSLGVRAVAVATGKTSPDRLAAAGPDALLADFSDTAQSIRAILG